jgi:hypothetical protein
MQHVHTDSTVSTGAWFRGLLPPGTIPPPLALNFITTEHMISHAGPAMDARIPNSTSPRPVKSTDEARQGVTGHNVRTVLITGTLAIIVIFSLLWYFNFAH